MTKVKGHNKKVYLIVEPMKNKPNSSVVPVLGYPVLKPGSSKVNMNIRNPTSRKIAVKTMLIVVRVAAANVVPSMLAQRNSKKIENMLDKRIESPNLNYKRETKIKLTKNQLEKNIQKLDLSGIKDWSEEDKMEVKN